jgi:hypothetical protein
MPRRARELPPLASDRDRIEAARLAAERLKAEMVETELIRAAWDAPGPHFTHHMDSAGAIHSERV